MKKNKFKQKKKINDILKIIDLSHYEFINFQKIKLFIPVLKNGKKVLILKFVKKSFSQMNDFQLDSNWQFLNKLGDQYEYSLINIEQSLDFTDNIEILKYKSEKLLNNKIRRFNLMNQEELQLLVDNESTSSNYLYITFDNDLEQLINYLFLNQDFEFLNFTNVIELLQLLSYKQFKQF